MYVSVSVNVHNVHEYYDFFTSDKQYLVFVHYNFFKLFTHPLVKGWKWHFSNKVPFEMGKSMVSASSLMLKNF